MCGAKFFPGAIKVGQRLIYFGGMGIREKGRIHIQRSSFTERGLAIPGVARGAAQAFNRTGGHAKVGGSGGGSQCFKCLVDCVLFGSVQPEVRGAAHVVGQAASHALLGAGRQGDTGHWRHIRLMTIPTAQAGCQCFTTNHVSSYARPLAGGCFTQEGFQIGGLLFGQPKVGHFGPRRSGVGGAKKISHSAGLVLLAHTSQRDAVVVVLGFENVAIQALQFRR